jgi:pantoate--beta-alanine ligase
MQVVTSVAAMQRLAKKWQRAGIKIGLVPTMGYLHAGHMSLVQRARKLVGKNGKVAVSIYVNPTQFGPKEDLSRYPRDLKRDLQLLREEGTDVMFVPSNEEMYPGRAKPARGDARPTSVGFSTYVVEEELSKSMEGASRPGHFRGVATVVAKLFNITLPDVAVFGAKDFQQAAVIKRMTRDLNFPITIDIAPTFREPDGLAMSSRNKYLSEKERVDAVVLSKLIERAQTLVADGPQKAHGLKLEVLRLVAWYPSVTRVDYIEFFDSSTLQPVEEVRKGHQVALAVFFGKTRLIDNAQL